MLQAISIDDQKVVQLFDIFKDGFSLSEFEIVIMSIGRTMDSVADSTNVRFLDTLKQAKRQNWINDLVVAAHKRSPNNADLAVFVVENYGDAFLSPDSKPAHLANVDPFDVTFLRSNHSVPFVNRKPLRTQLRQMFDIENGPRLMAVTSDLEQCGKSYTYELIRYLALHHEQRTAYIDIIDEWTADFGPAQLAGLIAEKIGADPAQMPAREAQMARWNKELCRWLTREIRKSNEFWWVVIDGLSQAPNLTVDLQDFVHELAAMVEKEDQPSHRLILISFSKDGLPINLRARAIEDTIHDRIGLNELTSFFTAEVNRLSAQPGIDLSDENDAATTLASWVHAELNEYAPEEQPYALELLIVKAMEQLLTPANQE